MYAIYARQSVEKKDSISIEMQIDLCKMYLPEYEKTEIFEDRGYSGTNTNRPAFRKMLAEVKAGKIKGIIVYNSHFFNTSMPIYEEFCKKQRFSNEKCRRTRVQNAMVRKSIKFFSEKLLTKLTLPYIIMLARMRTG